ncbi:MAG: hypothetical protein AB7G28_03435 [Pirellulales bacterium]
MPIVIRVRLAAIRLAHSLRLSILEETKTWEIGVDDEGRAGIVAGPFRLVITPRAVRLFDALHLYCDGAEIWLPLWWRLRMRNAVRLVLAENALEMLDVEEPTKTSKSARVARRREKQSA